MSNLIEIPEHLLPLFPESVPLLDADEIWSPFDNNSWSLRTFVFWIDYIFIHQEVVDFINQEVDNIMNCLGIQYRFCGMTGQQKADCWNDIMTRLGYTEISER